MRINKFSAETPLNFNRQIKKEDKKSATNPIQINQTASPVSPDFYAAYNKVSFKGKPYDGTNFRSELEKRAETSSTTLKIYPELKKVRNKDYKWEWEKTGEDKELKLYKTKHSEYVMSPDGAKIYKIRYVEDKDRITQQIMASKLYQSVGVRTPEYIAFEKNGKTGYLVEVFEEKLESAKTNKKALYESFVADVWLGNRNGLSKDNTKIDKDGNPVKMSVSGSLGYRASGKPKDKKFDYPIDEINTMRDQSINPDAAKELSQMTDEELYEAINSFTAKYNYETESSITGEYRHNETCAHDLHNVINNRYYNLTYFIKNDKDNKVLKKRGLLEEGTPSLTNLKNFDLSFSIDKESALKITDEQWQKLHDRDLFRAHYGLKKFGMLDYSYLAKMTDEEHQKALERNLYAPCRNDESYSDDIGGWEISELCKLTDKQWEVVKKRNLTELPLDHCMYGQVHEIVNATVNIDDYDYNDLLYSHLLDTGCKIGNIKQFVELNNNNQTKNLAPSFLKRVSVLSDIEKDKKYITDKNFKADYVLSLASIDNTKWDRLMEITNNLTDVKMHPQHLLSLVNFEDKAYQTLKERDLLTTTNNVIGLDEISLLSDEDWQNVKKRRLDEIKPDQYKDWAYLAALSDEQWQTALDKKLLENRSKKENNTNFYNGQEIAHLVTTLDEKDWENFEKRGLYNNYYTFNSWNHSFPDGLLAASLAKMTDEDFEKFTKISQEHYTLYPSTIQELLTLGDEQYNRLMKRNLFQYVNSYEAWDNYTEDAPVMKALAALDDEEYAAFLAQKNDCKTIAAKTLIIKADKLGLDKKHAINELSFKEKRQYLQLLLEKQYVFYSKNFQNNYNCTEIIPKNDEEYAQILNKLVKSAGIDIRPLDETDKAAFFNAMDKISASDSEFKNLNLKHPDFKLNVKYDRKDFMDDIEKLTENLDETEKMKVWDYFGFELQKNNNNQTVMLGYPSSINNGEKLKEIQNPDTKATIEKSKPFIKKFTTENAILADNRFVSAQMAEVLNDLMKGLPELYSIIGKQQHKTHSYTVDVHTLAVLQECIKNPEFTSLSKNEKQALILASLLHDITKEEYSIDKSHPKNSAYDAYFILEKFGLPQNEKLNIYQLIKNHDLLEQCNKQIIDPETGEKRPISEDKQNNLVKQYAYELRSDNLAKLEIMLTKADLLGVKRNGEFYEKYGAALEKISKKLEKDIKNIQKTSIALPQTKIPKASSLKADGDVVKETITKDKDNNDIKNKVIYLSPGLNLEKYGFDKGVTTDNFNVIVHVFDTKTQQSTLEALEFAQQEALLSASYVVYSKGNYHTFRPQGFVMQVPDDNIGAAYYRDFGSGCKKTTESLIKDYINGSNINYRNYIPNLMKKELNLSDDQYIALYKEIKGKPLNVLERENPKAANAIKKIFDQMEIHKRKYQRDYNEILVSKCKPSAIFFVGKDKDGNEYKVEDIPEFLRKYAQDNNLPIIYFGE